MAAETTTIADLLVGLGVKADPGALDMVERFDKAVKEITASVRGFSKVAAADAAGFEKLGASGASLAPLISQLGALQEKLAGLKSAGVTKLTVNAGGAGATTAPDGADKAATAAANASKKAASEADKASAAIDKQREKLKTIGASASAVDKTTLAFQREREAILQAAAATGDDAAAMKALEAVDKKEIAALAKLAEAEEKAAEKAAKLAEAKRKAAQQESAGIFSTENLASFMSGIDAGIGIIETAAKAMLALAASVVAVGTALAANSLLVAQDALYIERQADAIGATNEEYQKLRYTLGRFGVDQKDMADLYGQLNQQALSAASGVGSMADLFKKLGIDAKALLNLAPEEQLKVLADAMKGVTNPAERLAMASTLLGEDLAKKLTPLLIQGSGAIEELGDQAKRLGIVLTDEDIKASEKLTSQWATLVGMAEGLRIKIGAALIPVLADLAEKLSKWYEKNQEVINQKVEVFVNDVADAFKALGDAAEAADRVFGGASGFFDFVETLGKIAAGIFIVTSAVGLMAVGILPILAALTAEWTTLLLIVQDVYTYFTGGQSVIGALIDQYGQTDTLLGALVRTFQALGNVASAAFNLLSIGFNAAWAAASPFRDLLGEIADFAGGILLGAIQTLTAELTTFLNVLTAGLNGVATLLGSAPATTGAQALGATVGTGGAVGAALAPSASSLAATLAPTGPSASRGSTTNTITIQGATINGSGLDEAALTRALDQHSAAQLRQLNAGMLGMQV